MGGFGSTLGAFGTAYPQYVQQQQSQQMNNLQLKQALQTMAQQQQNRQAQQEAIQGLSKVTGSGPGGVITPQQLAALTSNPEAFAALNSVVRPANTGMYNLQGRDISGQYGLQRTQMQGDNAMDRVQAQQEGATQRTQMQGDNRMDAVQAQQEGANARNKNTVESRKSSATNPVNLASLPEFKTAKSQFEEAKKDERNIEAHYPSIGQAYNDPQWLDARKRAIAATKKMESIQSKVSKEAADTSPPAPQIPPEAVKQLKEGIVTTFGNGQKWTLTNGQPTQVQ